MLRVHSIETFGIGEGPGIRLVVFLQGCNFRCLYCQNPDTQDLNGGNLMSAQQILEKLEHQRPYFGNKGGLSVSGGEPLVQAKKLIELFKMTKEAGINTVLTTNGSVLNDTVKELLKYTDLVVQDIKHIDSKSHQKLTGQPNATVLEFTEYLRQIRKPLWLRHVIIPGYTDDPGDLKNWCEHFKDYENLEEIVLIPYHNLGVYKYALLNREYKLKDVVSPNREFMQNTVELFNQYFKKVTIR